MTTNIRENNNKKKTIRRTAIIVLCIAMIVITAIFPDTLNANSKAASESDIKSDISSLQEQQDDLQNELDSIQNEESSLLQQKNYTEQLITVTSEKIEASQELVDQLEQSIADKQTEIETKESEIETTFESFRTRMASSYEEGKSSYLGILLGSDSLEDFLTRADRVSSMLQYDKDLMSRYKTEKTDLETEEADLEEEKELQDSTLASLEADQAEYEQLSADSESYIAQLQNEESLTQSEIDDLIAQEDSLNDQLQKVIEQRQAALAAAAASNSSSSSSSSSGTATGSGNFIWPVSSRSISSYYGWRTLYGSSDFHYGIDIYCGYNTPVCASDGGTVIIAGWNNSYGNYIMIDHGNGFYTVYAHNTTLNVSVGQTVSQGDIIAYSGATGNATGPHCHFEIRNGTNQGATLNPLNYLS